MKLTRPVLKEIRDDIQNALDSAAASNVSLTLGACKFDEFEATFKLTVSVKGAKDRTRKHFETMLDFYNLDETKTSKISEDSPTLCKITEYNQRARSYPWIVQDQSTGHLYKLTDREAVKYFSK